MSLTLTDEFSRWHGLYLNGCLHSKFPGSRFSQFWTKVPKGNLDNFGDRDLLERRSFSSWRANCNPSKFFKRTDIAWSTGVDHTKCLLKGSATQTVWKAPLWVERRMYYILCVEKTTTQPPTNWHHPRSFWQQQQSLDAARRNSFELKYKANQNMDHIKLPVSLFPTFYGCWEKSNPLVLRNCPRALFPVSKLQDQCLFPKARIPT